MFNGVSHLEIDCFPEPLDTSEDIEQRLRPLVSAGPGLNFLQLRVVEVQRDVGCVWRHALPEHVEIRCVLQKVVPNAVAFIDQFDSLELGFHR